MTPYAPPAWTSIVEEHAGEAAFLFGQRRNAFQSWRQTLASLGELDQRLLAHLDGLEVAPAESWDLAGEWLGSKLAGEAFVAGWLALLAGGGKPLEALEAALAAPASLDGLSGALRLSTSPSAIATLQRLARAEVPGPRALACDALAFRAQEVPAAVTRALLLLDHPVAVLAGLGIATRRHQVELRAEVARARTHEHPRVASAALQAMAVLGDPSAAAAARETLARPDAAGETATRLLGMIGEPADAARLAAAARSGPHTRAATFALARHGTIGAADTLLEIAGTPLRSRAAGHAFELISGANLVADRLAFPTRSDPAEAAIGEDETLGIDLDDGLEVPDPGKLRAWWQRFERPKRDTRLRGGKEFAFDTVVAEAQYGALPDRDDALLELSARLPIGHQERRGWSTALAGTLSGLGREAKRHSKDQRIGAWHSPRPE